MWWLKEAGFWSQGFQLQDSFKNNYPRRLRAVSLFSWSVEQNAPRHANDHARDRKRELGLPPSFSRLRRLTLARVHSPY